MHMTKEILRWLSAAVLITVAGMVRAVPYQVLQVISRPTASSTNSSYFGYAVQLTRTAPSTFRLIVGSPRANGTGALEPGAVFSCNIAIVSGARPPCTQLSFGPSADRDGSDYKQRRDSQWLGGALDARNGTLVACAPRWINQKYRGYYFQNGMCYRLRLTGVDMADERATAERLLPLQNVSRQGFSRGAFKYYHYVYGEAGSSVHVTEDGQAVLGAPGLLQWKGSAARYPADSISIGRPFADVPNPLDVEEIDFFSYFGYAVSSGRFVRGGPRMFVAGAPRGHALLGQMFVYDYVRPDSMRLLHVEHGSELGEYFGAAVAVGDVTADGLDDIVIGAPMHSGVGLEAGRIYLLISDGRGRFHRHALSSPAGLSTGARYGTAISVIGDINSDGYGDVAVGAPYDGINGEGALYVLLGSKLGLVSRPYYRISGQQVGPRVAGFGISISNGLDVDGNHINDVAVGAYRNGHVVIVRHRPVAHVTVSLTANTSKLTIDEELTRPHKIELSACVNYTGKYVPDSAVFVLRFISDPYYGRTDQSTAQIERRLTCRLSVITCYRHVVTVVHTHGQPALRHVYTEPLEFRLSYELERTAYDDGDGGGGSTDESREPVLASDATRSAVVYVPYETNCGSDATCQPELRLTASWRADNDTGGTPTRLVLGSVRSIQAVVFVQNDGEPAFLCTLRVEHSAPLVSMPDRCQQVRPGLLDCYLGNPLEVSKSLVLRLDVSQLQETDGPLLVRMNVTSVGEERALQDNVALLELQLGTEVRTALNGLSEPSQLSLDDEASVPKDGHALLLVHQYELRSLGPSVLDSLQLHLFVPESLADGRTYVRVEQPLNATSDDSVRCLSTDEHAPAPKCASGQDTLADLPARRTVNLGCDAPERCVHFRCTVGGHPDELPARITYVVVRITMFINLSTLDDARGASDILAFTTTAVVTSPRFEDVCQQTSAVLLAAPKSIDLALWIAVGCASGVALLAATVCLLRKVGFFRRADLRRLEDERQNILEGTEMSAEQDGTTVEE